MKVSCELREDLRPKGLFMDGENQFLQSLLNVTWDNVTHEFYNLVNILGYSRMLLNF